jgi:hypothetical protein
MRVRMMIEMNIVVVERAYAWLAHGGFLKRGRCYTVPLAAMNSNLRWRCDDEADNTVNHSGGSYRSRRSQETAIVTLR